MLVLGVQAAGTGRDNNYIGRDNSLIVETVASIRRFSENKVSLAAGAHTGRRNRLQCTLLKGNPGGAK